VERYARLALGAAFLSAVAGRFGLWTGAPWGDAFARFVAYTAEVNAFMPALGSAVLLAIFGTAMAISFGLKSPMDYSVFSASAGALLLASRPRHAPDASR